VYGGISAQEMLLVELSDAGRAGGNARSVLRGTRRMDGRIAETPAAVQAVHRAS
jgi:hypothetical protein